MLRPVAGWRRRVVEAAAVLALTVVCYANSLHVPFVLDDKNNILDDVGVLAPTPSMLLDRRGLAKLTFAANYALGGTDVVGYHVVNIAIHCLNGLLVLALARLLLRLARQRGAELPAWVDHVPLVAALLFVAHPLQTQGVTYIVQRMASLAATFYLGAVLAYGHARCASQPRPRALLYGLAVVCALCAFRTKEHTVTLPFALALFDFLFLPGTPKQRLLWLGPIALTLAIVPLSLVAQGAGPVPATRVQTDVSRLTYFLTELRVVVTYLRLLVWPAGQNLVYDYPLSKSAAEPGVLGAAAILASLLGAACASIWRSRHGARPWLRWLGFGVLWFFLTLSIESSVFPIIDPIYEHRVYLPSVGAFLVVSVGLLLGLDRVGRWTRLGTATRWLGVGAIVLALSTATHLRNRVWASELSLWTDVVAKSPNHAAAVYNLGTAWLEADRLDLAIPLWRRTAELAPAHSEARSQLGSVAFMRGDLATARQLYELAIQLDDLNVEAHYNLALVLDSLGQPAEARAHLQRFVDLAPPSYAAQRADARARLGLR